MYTDLSVFTADPAYNPDVGRVFNYGRVMPARQSGASVGFAINLKDNLIEMIDNEIANAQAGKPAAVWAKLNALVHPEIIDALYRASQAGVKVELVVRGIVACGRAFPDCPTIFA